MHSSAWFSIVKVLVILLVFACTVRTLTEVFNQSTDVPATVVVYIMLQLMTFISLILHLSQQLVQ